MRPPAVRGDQSTAPCAATGGHSSQFKRRVLRLLGVDEAPRLRLGSSSVFGLACMIAFVLLALWHGGPLIVRRTTRRFRRRRKPIATPAPAAGLPIRLYHLQYVTAADMRSVIAPMCSKEGRIKAVGSRGKALTSGRDGSAGSVAVNAADELATDKTILVQDHEDVLKKIDRVVAATDVQARPGVGGRRLHSRQQFGTAQ